MYSMADARISQTSSQTTLGEVISGAEDGRLAPPASALVLFATADNSSASCGSAATFGLAWTH